MWGQCCCQLSSPHARLWWRDLLRLRLLWSCALRCSRGSRVYVHVLLLPFFTFFIALFALAPRPVLGSSSPASSSCSCPSHRSPSRPLSPPSCLGLFPSSRPGLPSSCSCLSPSRSCPFPPRSCPFPPRSCPFPPRSCPLPFPRSGPWPSSRPALWAPLLP